VFEQALRTANEKTARAGIDDLLSDTPDNWLVCHAIRREAEALLGTSDTAGGQR
jgi:hypothetical protein